MTTSTVVINNSRAPALPALLRRQPSGGPALGGLAHFVRDRLAASRSAPTPPPTGAQSGCWQRLRAQRPAARPLRLPHDQRARSLRVEWSEPFSGKLSVRLGQDCTASSMCSGGERHEPEPMDSAGAGEERVRVTGRRLPTNRDRRYHNRRLRPDERRMTTYNTMAFADGDIDNAASCCSRLT